MKKLFILLLVVVFWNCNDDEAGTVGVENSDITYMKEVYPSNRDCIDENYLFLETDNGTQEIYYDNHENGSELCYFPENNVSGFLCDGCEGHSASMRLPNHSFSIFPQDFPINIGSTWHANPDFTVTEINFESLNIMITIPDDLVDDLQPGLFYPSNYGEEGVRFSFHWSIIDESGSTYYETGYEIQLNKNLPYELELVCVDRSESDNVRLTWNFKGSFEGGSFETNNPNFVYSTFISGKVSYEINLE